MPNPYSPQEIWSMSNRKTRQVIAAQSVLPKMQRLSLSPNALTPPSQAIFAFFNRESIKILVASLADSGGLK